MIENIFNKVGSAISGVFNKTDDIITSAKINIHQTKEQLNSVSVNAKSTMNLSLSNHTHVNYFSNRVVGELIRIASLIAPYKKSTNNTYIAYLARVRKRGVLEYIKFERESLDSEETLISYIHIQKLISSRGTTRIIGKTTDKLLIIDDVISNSIYQSLDEKHAPYFLVHDISTKIELGDMYFLHRCKGVMQKLTTNKMALYNNGNNELRDKVSLLLSNAGLHLIMSYFKTIDVSFYKTVYLKPKSFDLMELVRCYNSQHFNVNKIISWSYDYSLRSTISMETIEDSKYTNVVYHGIVLKCTGALSYSDKNRPLNSLNVSLSSVILNQLNADLRNNFLCYLFYTDGSEDKDILLLKEEEEFKEVENNDATSIVIAEDILDFIQNTQESDLESLTSEDGEYIMNEKIIKDGEKKVYDVSMSTNPANLFDVKSEPIFTSEPIKTPINVFDETSTLDGIKPESMLMVEFEQINDNKEYTDFEQDKTIIKSLEVQQDNTELEGLENDALSPIVDKVEIIKSEQSIDRPVTQSRENETIRYEQKEDMIAKLKQKLNS